LENIGLIEFFDNVHVFFKILQPHNQSDLFVRISQKILEKLLKFHHFWKIQLKTNGLTVGPVLIFDHVDLVITKDFFNLSAKIAFFS
jgi:hypothetical protein